MPKDSINVGGKKYYYEYGYHPDMDEAIAHLKSIKKGGFSPQETQDLFENAEREAMSSPTGKGNAFFQTRLQKNFSIEAERVPGIFSRGNVRFKIIPRKE